MSRKARTITLDKDNPLEGRVGLIYARVSTVRQVIEGSGLDSQEARCIAHLESLNVPYEKSFRDSFTGMGDYLERPAMAALIKYVSQNRNKKYVVVFDDIKRFARDAYQHLRLRAALKAMDVEVRSPNFNFQEDEYGWFMELMSAGQAEVERRSNKKQVLQKMKARLEAGYWTFGSKKGYTMTKDPIHGKLAVPNEQGKVLKEAFEAFASGLFVRKIDACQFLVERGFWTKQAPGQYIEKFTDFARDPFYCGDIEYPEWGVSRRKAHHEGIISYETHDRLISRLRKNSGKARIRVDSSEDFPLRGLIVCSLCNKHLTGSWTTSRGGKNRYRYFWCQNYHCDLYNKFLRAEDTETAFNALLERSRLKGEADALATLMFDRAWDLELSTFKAQERKRESLSGALNEKLQSLMDLAAKSKNETVRDVYETKIEETANTLKAMEKPEKLDMDIPYQTALDKSLGMLKNPLSIWDIVDTAEKHRLFFFLFDAKLSYSKNDGYQTANLLSSTRLFEEFVTTNPLDVEMSEKTLNQIKSYLSRFWDYYQTSVSLQKALEFAG